MAQGVASLGGISVTRRGVPEESESALQELLDLIEAYARGERDGYDFSRLNRLSKRLKTLDPHVGRLRELLRGEEREIEAGAVALIYVAKRVDVRGLLNVLLTAPPEVEGVLSAIRESLPQLDSARRSVVLKMARAGLNNSSSRDGAFYLLETAAKSGWDLSDLAGPISEFLIPLDPASDLETEADRIRTPHLALRILKAAAGTSDLSASVPRLHALAKERRFLPEAREILSTLNEEG